MSSFTSAVRWNGVILLFVLIISNFFTLMDCSEEEEEGSTPSGRDEVGRHLRHHHGHHHHHHYNKSVGPGQPEESEDTGPATGSSVNLDSRLASLKADMRYLCMEDEEDIHRRIRHLGVKCICPTTEAPVCGSDNVTYHNRCFLHCHAKHALLNYQRHRITLKYFGECGHEI